MNRRYAPVSDGFLLVRTGVYQREPVLEFLQERTRRREEMKMATESITKQFIIKDDEACKKLIDALKNPSEKKVIKTNNYEKGKKQLVQFFSR